MPHLLTLSSFTAVSHIVMPPSLSPQPATPSIAYLFFIFTGHVTGQSHFKAFECKPVKSASVTFTIDASTFPSHFRSMVSSHRVTACLSVPYLFLSLSLLSSSDELTCWRTEAAAAVTLRSVCLSSGPLLIHSLSISLTFFDHITSLISVTHTLLHAGT